MQKEDFSIKFYMCELHLTKSQAYSSSRQTGCYIRTITTRVQLKKVSGRDPQRAWRQEGLIGGKPPVVK
jgi:hypothetical protein